MRITGGLYGGRGLKAPSDLRVRPTSDKVRQAMFNILLHREFPHDWSFASGPAIDLFAGTGALGIEALSHGAPFCLFVDEAAESRGLQRDNVEALGLTGVTKIWRRDATKLGPMAPGSGGPFTLAFLDPPYRKGLVVPALRALVAGGWLAASAVAVVETAADEDEPAAEGFECLDMRVYGETRVNFFVACPPQKRAP